MSRKGAPTFNSLLSNCVLWFTGQDSAGVSGGIDEFPIIPSGVSITNNGTFTKTSLGNNKSVLNFDGSTNYISLTDNNAWYFSGDHTINFWCKLNSIYGTDQSNTVFGQGTTFASLYYIAFAKNGTTYTIYWRSKNSGTQNWFVSFTSGILLNTWLMYTFVRNGAYIYKYLNGNLIGSATSVSGSTPNLSGGIGIGKITISDGIDFNYYLNGNLAHLMIWKDRALTQPEIKLLMARTHPITGTGLCPANGDYWRTS